MKCKYSLNNNYAIIQFNDIKEFDAKINKFTDKSWNQFTVDKNLTLHSNKLPIKSILKIHSNIKINSTKIIKTPNSDVSNIQGLKLTGKLLLVSGTICQNIIYNSNTLCKSIQSINLSTNFTTHIIIDKDSNVEDDTFSIYYYIQDIFLMPLNERTINSSITLFLFAHKIIGNNQKLRNFFILNSFNTDKEISKIEFDITNNILIVNSTNIPYANPNIATAFKFELKNSVESITKTSATIAGNENANNFKNILNEQKFEIGDIIEFEYNLASKLILKNYPNTGDTYNMTNPHSQKFLITQNAIIPILVSNKITVKSKNNEVVLTIELLKAQSKLTVSSKGIVADPLSTDPYFTLILKNQNGGDILRATLNSNEDGSSFKSIVNSQIVQYGQNSLTLIYKDKTKIEISNYPNKGDIYIPTLDFDIFKIEDGNFLDISIKSKIKIINDSNKEMSSLYFIKPSLNSNITTVAISTQAISTNTPQNNEKYIEYLRYSVSTPILYAEILKGENALNFKTNLDGNNIELNPFNIIRLSNRLNNRIIISNYRNQNEYMIGLEPEFLEIHQDSLKPHFINYNKIKLKNLDNSTVLVIYFDKLNDNTIYIELHSTGILNKDSNFFSFKITDPSESIVKIQGRTDKNQTADIIKIGTQPYNISKNFDIYDLLILEYSNSNLIEIFDFPFINPYYNPIGTSQKFRITKNKLVIEKIRPFFIFKTKDTQQEMAKIKSDMFTKKLIITSTGNIYNDASVATAFRFELKNATETRVKASASISGTEDANNFKTLLNNKTFEIGDIIILYYQDSNKIILKDYPDLNDVYSMSPTKKEKFEISTDGIKPILTPNKITVKSKNNEEVLTIQLAKESQKFIVSSTGVISDNLSIYPYFTLKVISKDGRDLINSITLNSNETGSIFKNLLNNQSFIYTNNRLILIYKDKTKIEISNYPTIGNNYIPDLDANIFEITSDNLLDVSFNSKIKVLSDNNEEVCLLQLPIISYNLIPFIATSTDIIGTNFIDANTPYVEILQYNENSTILLEKILGKESASNFISKLNTKFVEIIYPIRLSNKISNRIIITNYNNNLEYKIGEEPEFFFILGKHFIPYNLNYNKIRFKNSDNSSILFIYFNKINDTIIYIEPYSTGILNKDSDFFSFKIKDETETITKIEGRISKDETGDVVKIGVQPYNISKDFSIGDILILEYSNENLIEIFDFPVIRALYTPFSNSQKFKIAENGLYIAKLFNSFVFKTDKSNKEISKIEFDITNSKLLVNSTGTSYNNPNITTAFKFELKDSTEVTTKAFAIIEGNENANNFKNILHGQKFQIGDIIKLYYENSSKVILNDYPNIGDVYSMSTTVKEEKFIITLNGIKPILTPNKIIVKSKNNEEVLTIQFAKDVGKFLVSSTGIIADSLSIIPYSYFTLKVIGKDGRDLINSITLNSNESGYKFEKLLNNQSFAYTNNRLILIYKDRSKFEISNYPTIGDTYIPNLDANIFEITTDNLIDLSFNSKIKIFNDNNQEVCLLQFPIMTSDSIPIIGTNTNIIGTDYIKPNMPYIEFLHYNMNNSLILEKILGKESAFNFISELNTKSIETTFPIRISNRISNRIIITNYKTSLEYKIGEEPEFFKLSKNQLLPYDLNYNKIKLKNSDNSTVLFIYFDKINNTTIYIEPYSTETLNKDSDYFSFKIKDVTESITKIEGRIVKNQTGDVIKVGDQPYNISKDFNIGDILILEYSNKNLIEIFDSPTLGIIYTLFDTSQKFKITENGLIIEKFSTFFLFKTYDTNEEMGKIEFDITNKRLLVNSTSKSYNNPNIATAFKFELKNSNQTSVKLKANILGTENADNFKSILYGQEFEIGDIIILSYEDSSKVILNNYPDIGDIYNMPIFLSSQQFIITIHGIIPILTLNKITVKSKNNEEVLTIQFSKATERFIVSSTGVVPDSSSTDPYFTLKVINNYGLDLIDSISLNSNESGSKFKNLLNNQSFKYTDNRLILIYKDKDKIEISNYPKKGDIYTPTLDANIFKITIDKLVDVTFDSKIKILDDNSNEICVLQFINILSVFKMIIATCKDDIGTNLISPNVPYIQMLNYSKNDDLQLYEILSKENAKNFTFLLNSAKFLRDSPIRLSNRISNRIIVTNYKSNTEYIVKDEPEFFKISNSKLVPHALNYNKIRFKNNDDSTVLYIYFDKINIKIIYIQPYSTGVINNDSDYFSFKITDLNEQATKLEGKINKGETGDIINIKPIYNISKDFNINDLLILECSNRNLIEIFDFPIKGEVYIQKETTLKLLIEKNGLKQVQILNVFIFKNLPQTETIATIKFNEITKKLIVESTGISFKSSPIITAFEFKLKNSNQQSVKNGSKIFGGKNNNANNFAKQLNNTNFEFGDVIEVSAFFPECLILSNYPNKGDVYQPISLAIYSAYLKITPIGIIPI